MSQAPAQDKRAPASKKKRKRKEETVPSVLPEPKDIVSGSGQPLDPGVRRELEERLGHDFSRVRLHTSRDAGALTELLGADAVAVGQDIFFREGTYQPGTADGQRLLAHELLHTVQNPHGLGALKAGRDLGSVSMAAEPIEQEASLEEAPDVETGQPTPGWLRYTTVDADRSRLEKLDPATLVDRLANNVLRSLRGDPTDASGRVRLQLARMSPGLQDSVLDRLELRLPSPVYDRMLDRLYETETAVQGQFAASSPEPVDSVVEELAAEQDKADTERESEAERRKRRDADQQRSEGERERESEQEQRSESERVEGEDREQRKKREQDARQRHEQESEDAKKLNAAKDFEHDGERPKLDAEQGADAQAEQQAQQDAVRPAAAVAQAIAESTPTEETSKTGPSVGAAMAPGAESKAGQEKVKADAVEAVAQAPESPLVKHGLLGENCSDEPSPDELPLGLEPGATDEVPLPKLDDVVAETESDTGSEGDEGEPPEPVDEPDLNPVSVPERPEGSSNDSASAAKSDGPPTVPTMPEPPSMDADAEEQSQEEEPDDEAPEPDLSLGGLEFDADPFAGKSCSDPADVRPGPQVSAPPDLAEPEEGSEPVAAKPLAADPRPAGVTPTRLHSVAAGAIPTSGGAAGGSAGATASAGVVDSADSASSAGLETGPSAVMNSAGASETADFPTGAPGAEPMPADASLEPNGGGCEGTPESSLDLGGALPGLPSGGGGGGKGRGSRGKKPKKGKSAPDVAAMEPEAGLGAAAKLDPHEAADAMDGVRGAVNRSVGEERSKVKASPPTMERPSGAPRTLNGGPKPAAPGAYTKDKVAKVDAPDGKTPEVKGQKKPEGDAPGAKMKPPGFFDIAMGVLGKIASAFISSDDLTSSMDALPTRDKGLDGASVGTAPTVPLKDDSDPSRTDEQRTKLNHKGRDLHAQGRADAAKPMGEDQVYPDVPAETLKGKVPGAKTKRKGRKKSASAGSGKVPIDAVSVVASQERGPQIQAGFADGANRMGTERKAKVSGFKDSQAQHRKDVETAVASNSDAQTGEREDAMAKVSVHRRLWRKEQDDKLAEINGKTGKEYDKARKDIKDHKTKTDEKVDKRTKDDNNKIDQERTDAQKKSEDKRDEGKKDSGNWLSKAIDWVKEQFNKLKDAIIGFFKKARQAVTKIVDDFKKEAFDLIDDARRKIVGAINTFANILIGLGDILLFAFPGARDKWRKFINDARDAAVDKVNKLADGLKAIVGALLDKLAKALSSLLDVLEAGLLWAVDKAEGVVIEGLKYAQKAIDLAGEFAAIIADIAADPSGWIHGLKASAEDGAKHYLFNEIKTAVKEWFNDKLQELIGIPPAMFGMLLKGCLTIAQIGKMAWNAVVANLPMIIAELVITKVVAKLIPGAGWVMTIIDSIRTAWGALSEILAAFQTFINFLKAVKSGNAGRLFAKTIAAGVVALLEMVYEALVSSIGKYLRKVGVKLRGMAVRIMKAAKKKRPDQRKEDGKQINKVRNDIRGAAEVIRNPNIASPRARPVSAPQYRSGHPKSGRERKSQTRPMRNRRHFKMRRKLGGAKWAYEKAVAGIRGLQFRLAGSIYKKVIKNRMGRIVSPMRRILGGQHRSRVRGKSYAPSHLPQARKNLNFPTVHFRMGNGESHTLLFGGRGREFELVVHSDEESLQQYFDEWKPEIEKMSKESEKAPQRRALRSAERLRDTIEEMKENIKQRHLRDKKGNSILNDDRRVITDINTPQYELLRWAMTGLAEFMARRRGDVEDFPPTRFPPFVDGRRADESSITRFIHAGTRKGEDADRVNPGNPLGYEDGMRRWPDAIVRMHLLPDFLGGLASGNNLVPAPSRVNTRFYKRVESEANKVARNTEHPTMIWYRVKIDFRSGSAQNLPSKITADWNEYDYDKNRGWIPLPESISESHHYSEPVPPLRRPGEGYTVYPNHPSESGTILRRVFGSNEIGKVKLPERYADAIVEVRPVDGFADVDELKRLLEAEARKKGWTDIDEVLKKIEEVKSRISMKGEYD